MTTAAANRKSPWPKVSPLRGEAMAPAVLDIPFSERLDFIRHVGSHYLLKIFGYWPEAVRFAATTPYPQSLDDIGFAECFMKTSLASHVSALDAADEPLFAGHLTEDTAHYKVDYSAMAILKRLPGFHFAPSVTLLGLSDGRYRAKAIRVEGLTLAPDDGPAWQLAKLFVMQGAAHHIVGCSHIPLHFPWDTLNAVMKTVLPERHLLRQLLTPHFRFSLTLSDSALHSRTSVLRNHQLFLYSPFPCAGSSVDDMASLGWTGIPGNSGYPRFSFPLEPPPLVGEYGVFRGLYFAAIREFTASVTAQIPTDDRAIREWADHVAEWIPGFPDADGIAQPGVLASVAAMVIWNCSVAHGADHYSYARIPLEQIPFRLRVPPPRSREQAPFEPTALATPLDAMRHRMAWHMFFKEETITRLIDVDYGFETAELRARDATLKERLRATDANLPVHRFIPLGDIPASIQY